MGNFWPYFISSGLYYVFMVALPVTHHSYHGPYTPSGRSLPYKFLVVLFGTLWFH